MVMVIDVLVRECIQADRLIIPASLSAGTAFVTAQITATRHAVFFESIVDSLESFPLDLRGYGFQCACEAQK